jgi:tetratricopeptide (TPR) repeat protein
MKNKIKYDNEGEELIAQGKFQEAIKYYSILLSINESNPEILDARGFSYLQMGKFNLAFEDYNALIEKNPRNMLAQFIGHKDIGELYSSLKNKKLSVENYFLASNSLEQIKFRGFNIKEKKRKLNNILLESLARSNLNLANIKGQL